MRRAASGGLQFHYAGRPGSHHELQLPGGTVAERQIKNIKYLLHGSMIVVLWYLNR